MKINFKKSIFLFVSIFAPLSMAMASPAVGDKAEYKMTVTVEGNEINGSLSQELISYDGEKETFIQRTTSVVPGYETEVEDESVEVARLISGELVFANCESVKGTLEEVTVDAGTFEACKTSGLDSDGEPITVWNSKVPFGIVKGHSAEDGVQTVMSLKSFQLGTGDGPSN